jgi:hypothetical protein
MNTERPLGQEPPASCATKSLRLPTLIAAAGCWLGLVVAGAAAFMEIDLRPGPERIGRAEWPSESRLVRPTDRPTLVLVAHPKCPCTRATLEQLARIFTRSARGFRGYVLFAKPSGTGADWARTDSWSRAEELPGFTAVEDTDGAEARLFGATTSGHVFLFGQDGALLFSGGITAARGTEGPSTGMASIVEILNGQSPRFPKTPVFGCPVRDSEGEHQP